MKYPKAIMSIAELQKMGFPKEMLIRCTRFKNVPATKTPGGGKWLFDTEEFEKWRVKL